MEELLPQLQITLPNKAPLDPRALFPSQPKTIWLEIGFGGGEHLVAQAKANPDIGFIGCEPFVNGVASLLDHVDIAQTENIRILPDDARKLIDLLPDASVARCFVLFADPWPKARHAERRFIGPRNLPHLARILSKSAELRLATDDKNLTGWMKECVDAAPEFELLRHGDTPPPDWVETRYEQKAIKAGRKPVYMTYRRV
jgi:tRNA (guanine-N7-)-methyltransferase